jgi:Na+/melibiose symporter-like transporter
LSKANAWFSSAENIIALAGPLLGGMLIAVLGNRTALLLDAVSFLLSALLVASIRIQSLKPIQEARASSFIEDVHEGFQYIWQNPIIRYGSFLFLGTNFAITLFQANYIYFVTKVLGCTSTQLGLAFAIPGLGAIVGALISPGINKKIQPGTLILGCTVLAGAITLSLLMARDALSVALSWGVVTALGTINATTWFTLRQQVVPQFILGRVVALTRLLAFTAIPLSACIGGFIMNSTQNIYLIIALSALLRIAVGCIGFRTPLHSKRLAT